MKQIGTCYGLAVFALVALLVSTGCAPKGNAVSDQKTPPPAPESALNDPRIPPAQRAALEQTIAQQKASLERVDEKMKAHTAKKN